MKTLAGDRGIEWGWCYDHLPAGSGKVLDFGPMDGFQLSNDARNKGYTVTAIGVEPIEPPGEVTYIRQDILTVELTGLFDYVLNVSTTEHVGLADAQGRTRYGEPPNPNGDLEAMSKLRALMKPDARQILTIPIGRDAAVGNFHRVYGPGRLPQLLEGYEVLKQAYWVKADDDSQWLPCSKEQALAEIPIMPPVPNMIQLCYALGGYILCLT